MGNRIYFLRNVTQCLHNLPQEMKLLQKIFDDTIFVPISLTNV